MGGEGSMQLSINTLKANRALRRSKQRKFLNGGVETYTRYSRTINDTKLSVEELELVKKSIRTKIKKQNLKNSIIGFVLFSIPMILVLIFWEYIF